MLMKASQNVIKLKTVLQTDCRRHRHSCPVKLVRELAILSPFIRPSWIKHSRLLHFNQSLSHNYVISPHLNLIVGGRPTTPPNGTDENSFPEINKKKYEKTIFIRIFNSLYVARNELIKNANKNCKFF